MSILIDGYNVLYQSGLLGKGRGPGFLERARHALVRVIAAALGPDEAQQTTIVFDAKQSPYGAAAQQQEHGITVLYAQGYDDADALLEELIRRAPQPRRLLVVSSDRRVQQAARRRRARVIGAEQWLEELDRQPHAAERVTPSEEKPAEPQSDEQLAYWRGVFRAAMETPPELTEPDVAPSDQPAPPPETKDGVPLKDLDNPFPPGYADEI